MPAKRPTARARDVVANATRVRRAGATRGRGTRAMIAMSAPASKMRAFADDARAIVDGDGDLRRAIRHARASAERWPRGQRVGVDADDDRDARRAGDLRARLSSARASGARTGKGGRSNDLRDRIGGGRGRNGRRDGWKDGNGSGDAARRLLRELDLERYAEIFEREEIDLDALRAMRERDFTKLGIPYGPMVKITRALGR